jgi:hypothetical protein
MAKRQRAVRPGQRRSTTRSGPKPVATTAAPAPATGLTATEEARAAEIEAQIVAEERSATAASDRSRSRRSDPDAAARGRTKEGGLLASRATLEYAYVSADLRRIAIVAGALFALMIAIWVVLSLTGNVPF